MTTNIVVVEDERIVALNLQQRLKKLGYGVPAMAVSSKQAIAAVESAAPDIVLMDINIEGDVDGIETAEILMQQHSVPVIYLTAYSEENTLCRARKTKPYGYLLKPFSERELHATIQMALERRQYEVALSEQEQRLRLAMEAANMGEWELTCQNRHSQKLIAGHADTMLGYTESTFLGTREEFLTLVHPEDRAIVNDAIDRSVHQNRSLTVEFRSAEGGVAFHWLCLQGKMLEQPHDKLHVIGVIQNITERKLTEERLRQASTVFNNTQDGILILDPQGLVVTCNHSCSLLTGYDVAELVGQRPLVFQPNQPSAPLQQALLKGGQWRGEIPVTCKNGDTFPALVTLGTVFNEHQQVSHFILVLTDFSAIRSAEQKLQYLAHHDPLTGLPNRLLTFERLNQAILRAKRHNERVAVLFVDLDNFKWVNDSLGHAIGDEVLKSVAERVSSYLRADDTIGRLGGDEFLIIVDPLDSVQGVARVAQKLLHAASEPLTLSNSTIELSCSIGISLYPDDAGSSADLIGAADTAMYFAKELGRNGYEFFAPSMMEKAQRYLNLSHDLHRGLQAGELLLFYQPQISLRTGNITTLEVLVRWQHPQRGLLPASEIIPIAEDSGLIVEVGAWVLQESCAQLQRWREAGISDIRLAVNVSALQIHKRDFIDTVKRSLSASKVDPSTFEIEITESTLQHEENCINVMGQLREMGICITIDDFGTGYSCLSSLKHLPISKLKIDKSFIRDLATDDNDIAITQAVIAMAHKLGLDVVAEGVETPEQEALLKENGCDIVQGYMYYRPMSIADLELILQKRRGT